MGIMPVSSSLREPPKAPFPQLNKKVFSKSISISASNKSIVRQAPVIPTNKKISITKTEVKQANSNAKNNVSPSVVLNTKANLSIIKQENDIENIENEEMGEATENVSVHGKKAMKGFPCGKCPKRFAEKRGRRRHQKRKHQNVDNGDSTETETARKKITVKKEKVVVLGPTDNVLEKSFECGDCDKSFSRQSSLKNHKVLHLEELPYKCEHCEKTFSQAGNLRSHSARYHGVNIPTSRQKERKPESEAEDGSNVAMEKGAEEGADTSGSENLNEDFPNISYLCEHCDEVFPVGDDLSSHIRSVHNIFD